MTRNWRRAAALGVAGVILAGTAACSTRAPVDQIILYYAAGAGDNRTFVECIEPGTAGKFPVDDEIFALPTSLRTWNIRAEGGDTDKPIRSGSKPARDGQPGPEVVVYATAEFYLNTNCEGGSSSPVVQFWEKTGRRPWVDGKGVAVDGEEGFQLAAWRVMLLNTLVPAEEKAIREETRKYTADELDANLDGVWKKMEDALGATFLAELKAKTGGDYFCGPTFDRTKPDCPPIRISITDINLSDQGIVDARAAVFKAEQEAKARLIAAQAKLEESRILGQAAQNAAYLELKRIEADLEAAKACAANPNCTLIIGGNAGVNVNQRAR